MRTLKLTKPTKKGKEAFILREVRAWIDSDREDYCFAFVAICNRFGWSPDWIRRQVKESCGPIATAFRRNLVRGRPPIRTSGLIRL